jgi:hypothetical protein
MLVGRRRGTIAEGTVMKVAVLGGLGLQGRAAIADLAASAGVEEVICVDTALDGAARLAGLADLNRVRFVVPEGPIRPALVDVMRRVDAVVDLLPLPLMREAILAAIETRTPLVTTNYAKSVADLAPAAESSGVSIMTECGLDPAIDLVLYARAARQFDTITAIDSYCGGIPEEKTRTQPLSYKVSWNLDMVLMSQNRDSVLVEGGERVDVPARQQHDNPFIHEISVDGLGMLTMKFNPRANSHHAARTIPPQKCRRHADPRDRRREGDPRPDPGHPAGRGLPGQLGDQRRRRAHDPRAGLAVSAAHHRHRDARSPRRLCLGAQGARITARDVVHLHDRLRRHGERQITRRALRRDDHQAVDHAAPARRRRLRPSGLRLEPGKRDRFGLLKGGAQTASTEQFPVPDEIGGARLQISDRVEANGGTA